MDVVHRNIGLSFEDASGNTVAVKGWRAKKGDDLASGVGTVDATQFVPALAGDSCPARLGRRDAPGRTRTSDTRFRRAVLYPLSYEGVPDQS
jgi:hypothetical protein